MPVLAVTLTICAMGVYAANATFWIPPDPAFSPGPPPLAALHCHPPFDHQHAGIHADVKAQTASSGRASARPAANMVERLIDASR
jgi:hypothetical protein